MTEKTRLMLIIQWLNCGGAERVVLNLANGLDPENYEVTVVVFKPGGEYASELRDGIRLHVLGQRNMFSFFPIIGKLRAAYRRFRPQVVISHMFYANIVASLARFGLDNRFHLIGCEHGYPRAYLTDERFAAIKKVLIRFTYRRLDHVVGVSQEVTDSVVEDNRLAPAVGVFIPNPIPIAEIRRCTGLPAETSAFDGPGPVFLGVGRLEYNKRFDLMIEAFAELVKECPDAKLAIIGDGSQLGLLQEKARRCGVENAVIFAGFQSNPYAWFARATALVIASQREAFPMIILEAMASGTPVISTDCKTGPGEIIEHDRSGLLVPVHDVPAMTAAMARIVEEQGLAARLVEEARREVAQYDTARVIQRYEDLWSRK